MRRVRIKAVLVITNDGTDYLIHGAEGESPEQSFKAVSPLWDFNPETETAHAVTFDLVLPEFEAGGNAPDAD